MNIIFWIFPYWSILNKSEVQNGLINVMEMVKFDILDFWLFDTNIEIDEFEIFCYS